MMSPHSPGRPSTYPPVAHIVEEQAILLQGRLLLRQFPIGIPVQIGEHDVRRKGGVDPGDVRRIAPGQQLLVYRGAADNKGVLRYSGPQRLQIPKYLRTLLVAVVGAMLLVTAALLAFAYYAKPRQKETISYRDALIIGLAQACAAMPGLSRSGSTIATGLLLGNKKAAVAQFSFLMVLAPILGETLLQATSGDLTAGIAAGPLIAGFLASFITGCLACKFMIEVVKRGKLIWFAVYCTVAGLVSITSYFC